MPTMTLLDAGGNAVNIGIPVELPDLELRSTGLFTEAVPRISVEYEGADRIGMGVKWMSRDTYDVLIDTIVGCSADDTFVSEEIDLTENSTLPFSVADILRCSTLGGLGIEEINRRLDDDQEATRSFAFAAAATTQITPDHLNLADDSTSVGTGDIVDAMGLLEQGLGQRIANLRGYILIPLTLLAAAYDRNLVTEVGGRLRSPAGHTVIADAGHGPQATIFGTGAMAWAMSPPIEVANNGVWFDRGRNKLAGVRQRYGIVAFNPEHSVSATVS